MKKTLLSFSFLCASLFGSFQAAAQDPYTLTVFDQAVYYGMYQATVDEPVPAGAIRNSNSSYGKKLTDEQLASFGNTLTMTVTLNPLCDNYDRIGNVNLAFVPKGQETYVYNEVSRIELGRFITPFMDMHEEPSAVPYVFEIDNVAQIFHDETITSVYDLWVELEVYGYQGGPGQGGAAVEIPGCAGRSDVYMGSLEFVSEVDPEIDEVPNFMLPMSYKYELKNYTLEGTDVLGETMRTIRFVVEEPIPNAKFHLITSNHGSNQNGEEYNRRNHFIYLDNAQILMYKPGGLSCEPFRQYNTQGNGIYGPNPRTPAQWASFNNWCPGDKIPVRVIELGDLAAGEHSYKIDVPDAVFPQGQGYFPMSLYLQGDSGSAVLDVVSDFSIAKFSIFPNPASSIATINSQETVQAVEVYDMLGKKVWAGVTNTVDMSKLQNGIYIVKVKFEGGKTATQKLVKN